MSTFFFWHFKGYIMQSGNTDQTVQDKVNLCSVTDIFIISPVLQIRRSNGDNLGIINHISPLKHLFRPIKRTVSLR